jgi:hypothetical protein
LYYCMIVLLYNCMLNFGIVKGFQEEFRMDCHASLRMVEC